MSVSARPTRYVIVGAGHRSEMYIDAILGPHSASAEILAVSDINLVRAQYYRDRAEAAGVRIELIEPDDLVRFIRDSAVDRVIVTTPDFLHAKFIDLALRAGADVVVEKPLTIDAEGCRTIVRAVEETGRNVTVTFNYRYSPRNTALRQLIAGGSIGEVTSVHFEWLLDTAHGADYFRRWHRDKAKSGGLLIHKASHHFDLVNWWIGDSPEQVYARGGLRFYGAENARKRGLGPRPERGTHEGPTDPFQLDLRSDPRLKDLYLDAEAADGYIRDRDVFSEGITIEDNLSVLIDYSRGATMSYSLTAHSPWEGYRVAVNGTQGRVELDVVERAAVLLDETQILDPSAVEDAGGSGSARRREERLVLQRHWEPAQEIEIPSGGGGHGGGDALLLADVFEGAGEDPLLRQASWLDGIRSVSVGIAGNRSLATGAPVAIRDLSLGVELSDGRAS